MSGKRGVSSPRPMPKEQRVRLRVIAILLAYVLYRAIGDDDLVPGIVAALGFLLAAQAQLWRFSRERGRRRELLLVAATVVGLGFLAGGLYAGFA